MGFDVETSVPSVNENFLNFNNCPVNVSEEEIARLKTVLMISSRRPRAFYERAARELLASGHEYIELSALGDAIPLAIQLACILQQKKAVIVFNPRTKSLVPSIEQQSQDQNERRGSERGTKQGLRRKGRYVSSAPGMTIFLCRHPNFRGTRIVPGYVFFTPENPEVEILAYSETPDRVFASLNYITSLNISFNDHSIGNAFLQTFNSSDNNECYANVHEHLFNEALSTNTNINDLKDVNFVGKFKGIKNYHNGLKAAFCRICPELINSSPVKGVGTVFIDAFDDGHYPLNHENNSCIIHVISPKGEHFPQLNDFLNAITITATNLMTALCDFNGFVKRQSNEPKLRRLGIVRICLFSGDPDSCHPDATEAHVARAIFKGLNEGYHFGPAPRLQFSHPIFRQIWMEETSTTEDKLQVTISTFRKAVDPSSVQRRDPTNGQRREPSNGPRREPSNGSRREPFNGQRRESSNGSRREPFNGQRRSDMTRRG